MPINFFKFITLKDIEGPGHLKLTPSHEVEKYIEAFYVFSCHQEKGPQLLFNDGFPALIFAPRKDDFFKICINGTDCFKVEAAWVCSGVMRNIYVDYPYGVEELIVVRFKPFAFYKLFGISPGVFRNKSVLSLTELNGSESCMFIDKVYEAAGFRSRISAIESLVSSMLTNFEYPILLNETIDYINEKKGALTVQQVIKQLGSGMSYKWLERNFKSHMGISPKKYISLQRFLHAYIDFMSPEPYSLMEIAVKHGYSDHNHFLKDFKQFSGMSPGMYLSRGNRS